MHRYRYPQDKQSLQKKILANKTSFVSFYPLVQKIITNVKKNGNKAINEYTQKYDKISLNERELKVSKKEIANSKNRVSAEFKKAIKVAQQNIKKFHLKQLTPDIFYQGKYGEVLGQKINAIEKVGIYVPGGNAGSTPLVSSLLMNAIPAQIAGVSKIVAVSPPCGDHSLNPHLLYTFSVLGITDIYKCGGAQAIAGLAYGTESIPKVDIIVGPGNAYVTCAKKIVFGEVMIDGLYGHSEIVILSDGSHDARYIACDLLSQAEHAGGETCILISTKQKQLQEVESYLLAEKKKLSREKIIDNSLKEKGILVKTTTLSQAIQLINTIAPEHVEVLTKNSNKDAHKIKHAGAIFVGEHASEPIGDYICGTNHVLPTNGCARFQSPLGVYTFLKRSNWIEYNSKAFAAYQKQAQVLAEAEGLTAHKRALEVREKRNIKK